MKTRKYKKHAKINMNSHRFTRKQKNTITSQLFSISKSDAINDFEKLKLIGCDKKKNFSKVGNKFVNHFTAEERLETIGNKGVSFYDVWKNREKIFKEYPYIKKVIDYYAKNYNTYPTIKIWKRIYDLYYGSITIFRPLQAMEIYCRFKPTSVLDFTMGWGGRLVGACALDLVRYIGIDNNIHLKKPYKNMVQLLKKVSSTEIQLFFQDALKIDYSKLFYDMVLTSPPYYNLELYNGTNEKKSKEEWNKEFYEPIFERTYKYLQKGGYYCLNIPIEVYDKVAKPVLKSCKIKIPMKKFKRTTGKPYDEFIYIWKK